MVTKQHCRKTHPLKLRGKIRTVSLKLTSNVRLVGAVFVYTSLVALCYVDALCYVCLLFSGSSVLRRHVVF